MPRAPGLSLMLPLLMPCQRVLPLGVLTGCVAAITPPVDAAYSLVTGKDCSVVRWDQGKSYCRATERLPDALPYCTRSLGVVDCWRDPAAVPNLGPDVADGAHPLTPAQEKDRTRG
jgi:hypothetical protein